ncbi:MAG: DUF4835 family protein [Chitinophagaceae bacterium]
MMLYILITVLVWIFFYENEEAGRSGMLNCLNFLNTINTENPNSMILQFFFQGKSSEFVKIFDHASVMLKQGPGIYYLNWISLMLRLIKN